MNPVNPNISYVNYIDRLPHNLIVKVFQHLMPNVKDLCCNCNLVCKKWKKAAESNIIWKPLLAEHFPYSFKKCHQLTAPNYREIYLENLKIQHSIKKGRYQNLDIKSEFSYPLKSIGNLLVTENGLLDITSEKWKYNVEKIEIIDSQIVNQTVYNLSHEFIYIYSIESENKKSSLNISLDFENDYDQKYFPISFAVNEQFCCIRYHQDELSNLSQDWIRIYDLQTEKLIDQMELGEIQFSLDADPVQNLYKLDLTDEKLIIGRNDSLIIWRLKDKYSAELNIGSCYLFTIAENHVFLASNDFISSWNLETLSKNIDQLPLEIETTDEEILCVIKIQDNMLFCGYSIVDPLIFQTSTLGIIDLKTNDVLTIIRPTGYIISILLDNDKLITSTVNNIEDKKSKNHNIRTYKKTN